MYSSHQRRKKTNKKLISTIQLLAFKLELAYHGSNVLHAKAAMATLGKAFTADPRSPGGIAGGYLCVQLAVCAFGVADLLARSDS